MNQEQASFSLAVPGPLGGGRVFLFFALSTSYSMVYNFHPSHHFAQFSMVFHPKRAQSVHQKPHVFLPETAFRHR
jgi:hypothetical protein